MTTIYNYDASGVYTCSSIAQTCPLTGVDLLPANSTEIEPPDTIPPHIPIFDGQKWGVFVPEIPEKTQEQKADEQYYAIDRNITACIKTLDYDNAGQVALCCIGGEYQIEALRVQEWIDKCWKIQSDIKAGVIVFASVDDAIASLPIFEILV